MTSESLLWHPKGAYSSEILADVFLAVFFCMFIPEEFPIKSNSKIRNLS
jgi:hypothetical protein